MPWTTDSPTQEGWYLWRLKDMGIEKAFYVTRNNKGVLYAGATRGSMGFKVKPAEEVNSKHAAEWAGPIEEPTDADRT